MIDNFEWSQIRGEEQFHLEEEEELYGASTMKMVEQSHKEDEAFLKEMARKTAKKQVEESLSARKGKIPSLLELLELDDDEVPF
jgi:hypothetical protein